VAQQRICSGKQARLEGLPIRSDDFLSRRKWIAIYSSSSVTSFAPNITGTALFSLAPNDANNKFQMD
jgi:hypothetical protein